MNSLPSIVRSLHLHPLSCVGFCVSGGKSSTNRYQYTDKPPHTNILLQSAYYLLHPDTWRIGVKRPRNAHHLFIKKKLNKQEHEHTNILGVSPQYAIHVLFHPSPPNESSQYRNRIACHAMKGVCLPRTSSSNTQHVVGEWAFSCSQCDGVFIARFDTYL